MYTLALPDPKVATKWAFCVHVNIDTVHYVNTVHYANTVHYVNTVHANTAAAADAAAIIATFAPAIGGAPTTFLRIGLSVQTEGRRG